MTDFRLRRTVRSGGGVAPVNFSRLRSRCVQKRVRTIHRSITTNKADRERTLSPHFSEFIELYLRRGQTLARPLRMNAGTLSLSRSHLARQLGE